MKPKQQQLQKVEKKLLNIHSGAILIENKVNLLSRQAWFFLLYKAFPDLKTQDKFFVNLNELKEAIGYNSTNNKYLKQALKDLIGTPIEWNILHKDKVVWEVNSLLAGCKIEDNSSICEFAFSPFLRERLANPEMYTKLDLLVSKKFKSKHTLAIYCLALDYLQVKINFGSKNLTLEELRKYLGLEETEYPEVRNINQEIIKKAEKEINENSDLNISITPIRTSNRKILGFKFEMSIKDEFVESYKVPKLRTQIENKQTDIFNDIEVIDVEAEEVKNEIIKPKKELIKIELKELKEFFAEHKVSIATNTVQSNFKKVKEMFNDRFEDYLMFLMKYTKEELKQKNIKNVSGFYVGLLKDDIQLENYIVHLQNKEREEEKRRSRIKSLVEVEIRNKHEDYLSKDFDNWLEKNVIQLESKIIDILTKTISKGNYLYDLVISRHNKGIIDKTLITDSTDGTKRAIITHLRNYKEELDYKPLSFENWKNENIKEEDIKKLEEQLLNK
jgi:hypothetical protein